MSKLSTFTSVLVARKPHEAANEMERFLLREVSKCRIVSSLSGGAHFLFPRGETTLAVRVYYPSDVNRLLPSTQDALESFRDSFQHAVVIFIQPDPQLMMEHLSKSDSFVQLSQRIMNGGHMRGNAKTFIVPDTRSAIDCLVVMWDSLRPDRRQLRTMYYQEVRESHFVPPFSQDTSPDQTAIARHVILALKNLATRLELPEGDDDILLNQLRTLSNISSADSQVLAQLSIDPLSIKKLHSFFGSHLNLNRMGLFQDNHHDKVYDIDFSQSILEVAHPMPNSIPDYSLEFHEAQDLGFTRDRSLDNFDLCQLPNDMPHTYQPTHVQGLFEHSIQNGSHQQYITPNLRPEPIPWQSGQHLNPRLNPLEHWSSQQLPSQYSNYPNQHPSGNPYAYHPSYDFTPNRGATTFRPKGYTPGNSTMGHYYV